MQPSVHYLGVVGSAANQDHAQCAAQWERIKSERASEYGPDGAYNFGACIHGERFVGRGWNRDSAANGTQNGINYNPGSRAICALVGTDDPVTPQLEAAIASFAREAVEQHGMEWPLKGHSDFVATGCPGDRLRVFIGQFNSGATAPAVPLPSRRPDMPILYALPDRIMVAWFDGGKMKCRHIDGNEWASQVWQRSAFVGQVMSNNGQPFKVDNLDHFELVG